MGDVLSYSHALQKKGAKHDKWWLSREGWVLQPLSLSVVVGHFSAPASEREKWDVMGPSRVLRATIFLEDKIMRKDLNYRTAETQCLSLRLLFHCGIKGGPFGRPEGIVCTAYPVSFQSLHTSLSLFHLFFALLNSYLRGLGPAPKLSCIRGTVFPIDWDEVLTKRMHMLFMFSSCFSLPKSMAFSMWCTNVLRTYLLIPLIPFF